MERSPSIKLGPPVRYVSGGDLTDEGKLNKLDYQGSIVVLLPISPRTAGTKGVVVERSCGLSPAIASNEWAGLVVEPEPIAAKKGGHMFAATHGDRVKVHYVVRLEDGTEVDTSLGGLPMEFTLGDGELLEGFEEAIVGMKPGQIKVTVVSPHKAYGPHHEALVVELPREQFPSHVNPDVGENLQVTTESDRTIVATVIDVSESTVTLDANHPLAGRELSFEIHLLELG